MNWLELSNFPNAWLGDQDLITLFAVQLALATEYDRRGLGDAAAAATRAANELEWKLLEYA